MEQVYIGAITCAISPNGVGRPPHRGRSASGSRLYAQAESTGMARAATWRASAAARAAAVSRWARVLL